MKIPVVKEHGSWAVFIFSCAAAIVTGVMTRPWQSGKDFSFGLLFTVLGLVFLINSKNPLTSVLRTKSQKKENIIWLVFFSLAGLILLLPFLLGGMKTFLFFSPLILSYIALLYAGKEHNLITELNGFALIALSALIVYFVITDEISFRLYLAVLIFFGAGVFKVRARLRKTFTFKFLMILYCTASLFVYHYLGIAIIILLPLLENIVSVLWMREEKLKTTGNIELLKGIVFTMLLVFFW